MVGSSESPKVSPADRVFNFAAGPCVLPFEALQQAQQDLLCWNDGGMSVMEMSHRGSHFKSIFDQTLSDLRELLDVPQPTSAKNGSGHHILFTHGGATMQFSAVPLNLLPTQQGSVADFAVTGIWSSKASDEFKKFGTPHTACTSKLNNFRQIPSQSSWSLSPSSQYFHYCSNETINGVEFNECPSPDYSSVLSTPREVPLVSDMSSNFCSRPIQRLSDHAVLYAGLQKNLGPAGAAVVLVRDDVPGRALPICPVLLNYQTLCESNSLYNTPPCWTIYVTGLVLKHLKKFGGLQHWADYSKTKSQMLYDAIDSSDGFYVNRIDPTSRSRMNVPFEVLGAQGESSSESDRKSLEKQFLSIAKERYNLACLEGHRSVGGCRASLYNGLPLEGVEKLVTFMKEFQEEKSV